MGLRRYLLKRTLNTMILIMFVIMVNFVIFETIPGEQGVIALIAQNPRLDPLTKEHMIAVEEVRFGLRCGPLEGPRIPCPVWTKFERYLVAMVTFQFGNSFLTGKPVVYD